ncbi:hypothetical protein JOD28_001712 [Leuconostoc rapi]|nr:hypothetical protein [Leuconostoc rapi]
MSEIDQLIAHTTEEQYQDMANHVRQVGYLIRQGYFTKKVLIDTIHRLLTC